MSKLTSFKLKEDMTIEQGWVQIQDLRRRVVAANPELAPAFTEKQLFNLLLSGLPDDYRITRATLDAQRSLGTYEKLDILKDEEEKINQDRGVVLYAKKSF
jgi:hypothetical protein